MTSEQIGVQLKSYKFYSANMDSERTGGTPSSIAGRLEILTTPFSNFSSKMQAPWWTREMCSECEQFV